MLKGKRFLPLARQLFSSRHPQCTSQNAVEEAVLAQALALLQRLGLPAIVLGDKGLGRKELIIRLANQDQDAVLRVDADIKVYLPEAPDGLLLTAALAQHGRVEVAYRDGDMVDLGEQGHEGRTPPPSGARQRRTPTRPS